MDNAGKGAAPALERLPDIELAPNNGLHLELDTADSHDQITTGLRVAWEHRRFLFRCTAFGLLLSAVIAFLIPVQYESSTQLVPPDPANGGLALFTALATQAGSGLGAAASDLLGFKSSGALFIGVLQSRTVQDHLVDRFDLRKIYSTKRWADARKRLASNTDISEDRKSGIIWIGVTDRNPQRAQALAQAYVEELNHAVTELSTSSARRERIFLEERLHAVKQDLDSAAVEFSQFASKNTAIDIPEQGKAMVQAAAGLQGQLVAAQSELSGLEQVYTSNNVRVRSLKARIAELQHQTEKLGGKDLEASTTDSSTGYVDSLYPSIRKLPLLGVRYYDLYRKLKIQETVFEILTKQYELAKVQEAKEIPTIKVLDRANIPERKSFPPRILIMVTGLMFFLFMGTIWVFASNAWREADPHDSRKVLAQEVFSSVRLFLPSASRNGFMRTAGTTLKWRAAERHKRQRNELP